MTDDDDLPADVVEERERRVLRHMLETPPQKHKPLGDGPQAKRRAKERRVAQRP